MKVERACTAYSAFANATVICGKPSLNDFLHALVSQYEKRKLRRTYVAVQGEDCRVLGYYALASGSVEAGTMSRSDRPRVFI